MVEVDPKREGDDAATPAEDVSPAANVADGAAATEAATTGEADPTVADGAAATGEAATKATERVDLNRLTFTDYFDISRMIHLVVRVDSNPDRLPAYIWDVSGEKIFGRIDKDPTNPDVFRLYTVQGGRLLDYQPSEGYSSFEKARKALIFELREKYFHVC